MTRCVFVVEGFQPGFDVFPELSRDDAVESDYQHITPVSGESLGVEDTLYTTHEAERLAATWSGHATDRVSVRVYQGQHLFTADPLIPWFCHSRRV